MEEELQEENFSGQEDRSLGKYGTALVSWEVDEYPHHERSRRWYLIAGAISLALIIYAIMTANFLFALIILMVDIIFILMIFKKPDRLAVVLTNTGMLVGEAYYAYSSMRDFSLLYEPPQIKTLYIDFYSPWRPMLSLPIEETDPNIIREILLNFCEENLHRNEETLTDILRRLYKL